MCWTIPQIVILCLCALIAQFAKTIRGILFILRRFAAVSPFCFGYPTQPDIASWRIRIIRISIDGRFPSPPPIRGLSRPSSSSQWTFFRFTGTMHGLLKILGQACYSNEFKRRRFQKRSVVGLCPKARNRSGGTIDDVDRSTSSWIVAWSILWTSPAWAVLCGRQCGLSFFALVDLGNE